MQPPRGSVPFWTVGAVLTLFLAGASAPSPLYALYAQRWGFSPVTLTVVFAVYALALLAVLLTCGGLSDAVGRRPVLLAGTALQAAARTGSSAARCPPSCASSAPSPASCSTAARRNG